MRRPRSPALYRRASRRRRAWRAWLPWTAIGLWILDPISAVALITGGTGNEPIADPGWPAGAAAVFNSPERVAWWEGPPFGGGEWHGEYRGNADALNRALAEFARIEADKRRIVVHDGVGRSFWLNPNREPENEAAARIDWTFVVWQFDRWLMQRDLPADFRPRGIDQDGGPVPQMDIYTGGNIRWKDVEVPKGIEIVDERLEAHGFSLDDGTVLEGKVLDVGTEAPLAARIRLERIDRAPEGGYRYTTVAQADADENGRWVLKHTPAGWHRVVVEAPGYVPRIAGYGQYDDDPRWFAYNTGLSRPAPVSGRVTDSEGRPLADVDVRLQSVVAEPGGPYESPDEYKVKTDAQGRFVVEQVPHGGARISVHKGGYCRPGLGPEIEMPAEDVSLTMMRSATIIVTVEFGEDADIPVDYIVEIEPEGGAVVGRWGGSGRIDAEGKIKFENVPPGTYVLTGRPNPGREDDVTDPVPIELQGGEEWVATLKAK